MPMAMRLFIESNDVLCRNPQYRRDNYGYCSYNLGMITVGVRELKNQLSMYLQHVKGGEKVIVTEHNKIIAEISLPQKEENLCPIDEKLEKLSKEGLIILAKRKKSCVNFPKIEEKLDWESVYNEIRADKV